MEEEMMKHSVKSREVAEKEVITSLPRNSGVDILRIMCCVGVLVYHVADDTFAISGLKFTKSMFLYFSGSFCIPVFFMISGYCVMSKVSISFDYIENKIKTLFSKMFGWYIFFILLEYLYTQRLLNVIDEMENGFISSGLLPISWFIFTLCILLILAYPLHFIMKKTPRIYCLSGIILIIILGFIKNFYFKGEFIISGTQSTWFIIYLPYWILGSSLFLLLKYLSSKIKNQPIFIAAVVGMIITFLIYIFGIINVDTYYSPAEYYGTHIYSLWVVCLFIMFIYFPINRNLSVIIKRISQNTFTVYLYHLPVLIGLTAKFPITNVKRVILYVIFLFVGGNIIAELFKKLPLLRRIV
jgi:surface polysaccharide O-acyltransferase-like enzyme